jgi:uncharacterized protein YbaR (Trm112 family)
MRPNAARFLKSASTPGATMIAESYLKLLVCPENHMPLEQADPSLVESLNARAARGELKTKSGRVLAAELDGALVRVDKKVAYPIVDKIPMLLVDEGILLDQIV